MRRFLDLGVRIAISVALLLLVARKIELGPMLDTLRHVAWVPMLFSYTLIPLAGYIDANRTKMMTDLQGMTLTVGQICRISFITSFYSLFLPGHLAGGLVRWHRLSRHDKKPAQALAIVIFGRLFSTIVTVGFGLACWCLDARARAAPVFGLMLLALLAGLVFAYWLMFSGNRARWVSAWIPKQHWISARIGSKVCKVLDSAALFEQLSTSTLLSTVGLMMLNEAIGVFSFWLLAVSLDMGLSVVSIGWVRTYVMLVTMIPVSILGIGVREGSLIAILGTYGLAPSLAVAYSVLLLTRTILLGLLGGACEAWNVFRFRSDALHGSARP